MRDLMELEGDIGPPKSNFIPHSPGLGMSDSDLKLKYFKLLLAMEAARARFYPKKPSRPSINFCVQASLGFHHDFIRYYELI